MNDLSPVYNSRIIGTYLEYLREEHPEVNPEAILEYAEMTKFQVADPAYWFNQRQVDRFQKKIVEVTGDPDIARAAGRFAASTKALGAAKQVVLGIPSLASCYLLVGRIYNLMSRGAVAKTKRLGASKIEIVSRPVEGINEKPFQCRNRMGFLEATGKIFTLRFPTIDHPECFHKGDAQCRYVIRWEDTPSLRWKRIRNIGSLLGMVTSLAALVILPFESWLLLLLSLTVILTGIHSYSQLLGRKELLRQMESQGEAAREHIEGIRERYNDALLVQEIGHATSRILDTEPLVSIIAETMQRHLVHDRGMIFLNGGAEGRLRCVASYGDYGDAPRPRTGSTLSLPSISSSEVWVWFSDAPKPSSESALSSHEELAEGEGEELGRLMGVKSVIVVPILYEEKVLGLLAVGRTDEERVPTQSDLSLLKIIASQAAASLSNASSFKKLQVSEEKYRNILETIEEAYFEVDLAGNFTFFNDSLCRISRYTRSELLGMHYKAYSTPDTARKLFEVFSRVHRTGKSAKAMDCEIVRRDGDKRHLELSASIVQDASGQHVGFRGIVRDVTERIQAEKRNKMLEIQLRQSQKLEAIGTLAGGIAHDFNNILAAIIGYAELASLSSPEATGSKRHIREIMKAGHRARDLVKQILAFSRQNESQRIRMELASVVKEALKFLRASLPTTIEIRQNLDACGQIVQADPTQMHQVLMNLCTNAHHAMQQTGGVLEVSLRPFDLTERESGVRACLEPGLYLSLEVRDTGTGIDPQVLDRVFEPFYTTKGPGEGTGMGLAVVHGIVQSHGGTIEVYSKPGDGTTFQILLPCINGELQPDHDVTATLPSGRGRILFIDDEFPLTDLAQEILERLGYSVEPWTNPVEALEAFRAQPDAFNLVITDKTMPNMTGFDLAGELRKIRSDIPIILCTGFSDAGDSEKSEALGIARILMKPLSMHVLATAVREVLDGTPPSQEIRL